MTPTARRGTLDDVPSLVQLMEEFYAEAGLELDRQEAMETFARLLHDPSRGTVWLLEIGTECAGYIVLTVRFSMEYGGLDAFVDDLYVRPLFRRRGVGRLALAALFADCNQRGIRAVHLEVGRDNDSARRLYDRFGFRDNRRLLLTVRLPNSPNGGLPSH